MDQRMEECRRKHKRFGQSGAVTMRRIASGPHLTGALFEISTGGCLIWTDWLTPFEPAELIEVRLQVGPLGLRVMGDIRHVSEEGRLLGVEFHRLAEKQLLDLQHFILELEASMERENLTASV